MSKILIIRFSSIGDIVLTTPVIRSIKLQVADAEVHYCTKSSYLNCVQYNPYIDKIHLLKGNDLRSLINELKAEQYDYIIDLHNNMRTLFIKFSLKVPSFSVNKLNIRKWLLVKFKINIMPPLHIVDRYMAAVQKLGVKDDGLGLDFPIPVEHIVDVTDFPLAFRVGYVVFVIGAKHATKQMPADKIIEFAKQINQPTLLVGGSEDSELGTKVHKVLYAADIPVLNLCGKYSLLQSASLLTGANLIITNDTGLMHIAAAMKKKIVVAWGSTVPDFGMYPYRADYISLENKNLNCRPCSKIGFAKCPKGHFKCMVELSLPKNITKNDDILS